MHFSLGYPLEKQAKVILEILLAVAMTPDGHKTAGKEYIP
jgi:hypothetical protein